MTKKWGQFSAQFTCAVVKEPAGYEGDFVTLPRGAQVNRNGRTVYATREEAGTAEPFPVLRPSKYGTY